LNSATDTMEQAAFYDASEGAGLAYGPQFRGITAMYRGTGNCSWRIRLTDRTVSTPKGSESKHLIHPTTLDATMHSLFGAINKGKDFESAALPVSVDRIVISAEMPVDVGTQISGFTVTRGSGSREVTADIYVSSDDWSRPLMQIEGLRCTELPSQKIALSVPQTESSPLGTITWQPDIDLLDEKGLMRYIEENYKYRSPSGRQVEALSEKLHNAVAQVRHTPNAKAKVR